MTLRRTRRVLRAPSAMCEPIEPAHNRERERERERESRAEQSRAEQSRAEQSRAGPAQVRHKLQCLDQADVPLLDADSTLPTVVSLAEQMLRHRAAAAAKIAASAARPGSATAGTKSLAHLIPPWACKRTTATTTKGRSGSGAAASVAAAAAVALAPDEVPLAMARPKRSMSSKLCMPLVGAELMLKGTSKQKGRLKNALEHCELLLRYRPTPIRNGR